MRIKVERKEHSYSPPRPNIAISIYYYLNLVRHAYTKEAPQESPAPIPYPVFSLLWGGFLAALLILFGILPGLVFKVLLPS